MKPIVVPVLPKRNPLAVPARVKTGAGKHQDKKRKDKQTHKPYTD